MRRANHTMNREDREARLRRIAHAVNINPDMSRAAIARRFGCDPSTVAAAMADPRWWPAEGQAMLARALQKARA